MSTFSDRQKALGVSADSDKDVVTLIHVQDVDELKQILNASPGPAAAGSASPKLASSAAMFDGIPANADLETQLLRKISAYCYDDAVLNPKDREMVNTAFPMTVGVASGPPLVVNNELDLGTLVPGSGPIVLNYGQVTLNPGGYIVVRGRPLTFTMDTLVRNGSTGNAYSDFNILGVTGTAGTKGSSPSAPGQATNGSPGNCSSAGIAGSPGTEGKPGAPGTPGGQGNPGGPGKPSMPAVITITSNVVTASNVPVTFATSSGAGGQGGPGGDGSTGGQGGNGGNGVTCGCTGNSGGAGGQGGKGGTAGSGGPGGDGVDAAGNITINVPAAFVSQISKISFDAQPGSGGAPGSPGAAGLGGAASSGGKHNDGGSAGGKGAVGDPGSTGVPGTRTGKPAVINVQPT